MKVRRLRSPRVFPTRAFDSTDTSHSRSTRSLGNLIFSVLCFTWSSINKLVATIDVPKSHSCFERAYQDWILPQIQIKSVSFISLSVLCLYAGLTVFPQEDPQSFDIITRWSFKLSLSLMPFVFSSAAFILVMLYFFPQLMEKKQHYVITLLCLTAMIFVPAGNVLLNIGRHGAARMETLLLNAHLLLLTLLYYNQGFIKIIVISIIIYLFINLVNIFTTFSLQCAVQHPMRQVSLTVVSLVYTTQLLTCYLIYVLLIFMQLYFICSCHVL